MDRRIEYVTNCNADVCLLRYVFQFATNDWNMNVIVGGNQKIMQENPSKLTIGLQNIDISIANMTICHRGWGVAIILFEFHIWKIHLAEHTHTQAIHTKLID